MSASRFLAIDLGAESGRGVLGTLAGGKLNLAEVHRFPNGPVRVLDALHWDTLRLWSEVKHALAIAAKQAGGLQGLGVDTWGVDFGLLGRGDVLLGNPFHYRDARTNGILEKAFAIVPREEIFSQTGIQFMQFNTVFQLLAMRLQGSAVLEHAETMLMMPDLLHFWFTGIKRGEFTNATTTQAYDPRRGGWADDLIDRMGIPSRIFPEIVPAGSLLGPIRPEIADETGAGPVPVIAPATHDTGSAVAAVPAETGRPWCFLSSGTWSLMGMEIPEPIINEQSLSYNFTNEGGVGGTYRFLKNIMGLWLVQECRRTWERAGQSYTYAELTRLAEDAPRFQAVLDPDHPSFLAPGDMPARIAAFCERTGQPAPRTPGGLVRASLESLALKYRATLGRIERMTGRRVEVIHMVGGGIQNRLLCQWAADATGRTVVAGPVEATAAGNIIVQAMAAGVLGSLDEARQVIRRSFEVSTYEPVDPQRWDEPYQRFEQIEQI